MTSNLFSNRSMMPCSLRSLKKVKIIYLTLAAPLFLSFTDNPTLADDSYAWTKRVNYAGNWIGTFIVRPPGQEEIKKYKIILKIGEEIIRESIDSPVHEYLEVKVALEGSSKFVDLTPFTKTGTPKGSLLISKANLYDDARSTWYTASRGDGTLFSANSLEESPKDFPDCASGIRFSHLKISPSNDYIEGEMGCNTGFRKFIQNSGKITLQKVGSTGAAEAPPQLPTSQSQPSGASVVGSPVTPERPQNGQNPQDQNTSTRNPSGSNLVEDTVKKYIPRVL
jgi:heat shock protein HslJ